MYVIEKYKINIKFILLRNKIAVLNLENKKIPEATNVAECIKAEAGSGASIDSGSQ